MQRARGVPPNFIKSSRPRSQVNLLNSLLNQKKPQRVGGSVLSSISPHPMLYHPTTIKGNAMLSGNRIIVFV